MLGYRKIAVTGGLSSGKSSVCRFFKDLGAYVVSADLIVHQLLSPETAPGQKVIRLLGEEILVDRQIDRLKVAQKVFNNPELLKSLEKILHPAVLDEIERNYQTAYREQKTSLFMAEVPLLFEIGAEKRYDCAIAILADPKVSQQRFMDATGLDAIAYDKRMAQQLSPYEKAYKADYVIINNGNLADVQEMVKILFDQLTQ
ncbi:dephospho-CoA kinase [Parachlamydia sp. AcF125]|uniref:dephospho-CoA kinase n=1 Tax=Parachlamydia sp. AcF125 TaxID=2795736 RepID=UPI001BCA540C|nr:dephospho-CoA kinase [Parachlamydia sp. AcF125]MBS4168237.1 Dephospho-CoA kinase [Parachlamydia sp. AcF125]